MSWNVLADAYVRREYYPHTTAVVLDRAGRRRAVAKRLATFTKVDVLCLQEVDTALYALAEQSLPDSVGRLFRKRGRGEGCALFVRGALTSEPSFRELVFTDRSGHVALGVTFAGVSVVTTHLKWEPPGTPPETHRGRVQLAEILDAWPAAGLVVCGDLNAEPESEVVALATARGLKDAYASLPATESYTCNANQQRKRIDFILHSPDFTATPVPLAPLDDETPMPSDTEPSDHLAIEVRLDR